MISVAIRGLSAKSNSKSPVFFTWETLFNDEISNW